MRGNTDIIGNTKATSIGQGGIVTPMGRTKIGIGSTSQADAGPGAVERDGAVIAPSALTAKQSVANSLPVFPRRAYQYNIYRVYASQS